MGIRDAINSFLGRGDQSGSGVAAIEWGNMRSSVLGMTSEELFRTQPYLRTVITFLARNIAQLGLHTFERVSDTDRRRVRDDPVAVLLRRPNDHMTTYDLVFALVADLALHDEAFWLLYADVDAPSGWSIEPLSPSWVVRRGGDSVFTIDWVDFQRPNGGQVVRVSRADLLWFKGWNPGSPRSASSPVEALKQILAEQISASIYREQLWRRGGRIGGYLTRPPGAQWDPKVREKFQTQWQAKYAGNDGALAGATPILEDGMEYKNAGHSSHEEEFVEAAKLALTTVASVYHVNPTMVGLLDNANFSNVKEFRSMLYGDTLGSTISMLEDAFNTFLVPKVSKIKDLYLEFNISEKLQGSFEEQAAALSTSVGRPWMVADEARARLNMPALGGDAAVLVTPLNVLVGGQASPRDSAPKSIGTLEAKAATASLKADDVETEPYVKKAEEVLTAFFRRQRAAVLSRLGAKAAGDYWDEERWNSELSDDLFALSVSTATALGREQAKLMGFTAADYDEDRTLAFLRAVADSRAGAVNSTTQARIEAAIEDGEDPADVFEEAESARSTSGATALVAALAGFALMEAGSQLVGNRAKKTWLTTSDNPRSSHAAMNGETVPIQSNFSNGAKWPGDAVLGVDEVAGCLCSLQIDY